MRPLEYTYTHYTLLKQYKGEQPQDCPYETLQSAAVQTVLLVFAPFLCMQLQNFSSCSIVKFFLLQCVLL